MTAIDTETRHERSGGALAQHVQFVPGRREGGKFEGPCRQGWQGDAIRDDAHRSITSAPAGGVQLMTPEAAA